MKNSIQIITAAFFALLLVVLNSSCKKDATVIPSVTTISNVTTDVTTLSDVQTLSCQLPDTVNISDLPSSVTSYVSNNYSGYTTQFVYAVKSNGTLTGYLVNLLNGTMHTLVRFDATGIFVKVLTLPAHTGFAMFQTDTIASSTIPTALQTYLTENSSTYTVQHIFMEVDSSYTVIASQNTTAFALLYSKATPDGLSVVNLGTVDFTTPNPDINTLPSSIANYINQNYNGATVERILVGNCSGGSNGYTVIFKQNATNYAVEFDSSGAFTEVIKSN